MRRLCAAVLVCEALVIVLAIPVAISVGHADARSTGIAGGALAAAGLALTALLRFRWSYVAGSILQILVLASGFLVPVMFFLGVVFGLLWITAIRLGLRLERTPAR